ncbi:MAG: hypothetical protein DRQ02_04950 [Candidatus Latescibacterota bacterium]|nr:MAG: hypothetical protein DRQ02_04950 [Candidatus Latescibacterota bacterium]RKY71657.1 MAG: hypothetical protein DRQ24_06910 [Candidatus Latescibacterota bacterium]
MHIRILKISLLSLIVVFSFAVACFGTQQAGAFLDIGVDARAMGMGGAFGAVADNAFAPYWNPAGISLLRHREAGLMYASLFGLAKFHCFSLVQPIGEGVGISAGWVRFSVDRIPEYEPFPEDLKKIKQRKDFAERGPVGYFSDTEDALFFSFGKTSRFELDFGWLYFTLPVEVPFGVNLKLIRQSMGGSSAQAVGFDLGTMVRFGADRLFGADFLGDVSLGLVFRDVANTVLLWDTKHSDVVSHSTRFGVAYRQPLPGRASQVLIAVDRDKQGVKTGLEYQFSWPVAVRIGFGQNGFCAGAGLGYRIFHLDYAFVNQPLGPVHRVSGRLRF